MHGTSTLSRRERNTWVCAHTYTHEQRAPILPLLAFFFFFLSPFKPERVELEGHGICPSVPLAPRRPGRLLSRGGRSSCEGIRAHPGLAALIVPPQPFFWSAPLLSFQRGVNLLSVFEILAKLLGGFWMQIFRAVEQRRIHLVICIKMKHFLNEFLGKKHVGLNQSGLGAIISSHYEGRISQHFQTPGKLFQIPGSLRSPIGELSIFFSCRNLQACS